MAHRSPSSARRAFSVVELLVIIGIVIGVISTLVVGLSIATRRARGANTEFLMNSIASALAGVIAGPSARQSNSALCEYSKCPV